MIYGGEFFCVLDNTPPLVRIIYLLRFYSDFKSEKILSNEVFFMSGNIAVFAALVFPLGGFFYNVGSDIGKYLYGEGLYVIIFALIGLAAGVVIGSLISWLVVSGTQKDDKAEREALQKSLNALEKRLRKEFNRKINALKKELQEKNFEAASIPEAEIEINESKPEEIPEVKEIIEADKERDAKLAKAATTTAAVTGTVAGLGAGAQLAVLGAGILGGPLGMIAAAVIGGGAGLIAGKFFGSKDE